MTTHEIGTREQWLKARQFTDRRQGRPGFEQGLEARQDLRPADADCTDQLRTGLVDFVGDGQPHDLARRMTFVLENNSRMNSRKSANPRSTKHAQQHGFCLIVECVRRRDLGYVALAREFAEKTVAHLARRSLNA